MTSEDVIVIGAGPTGLMVAAELCAAGVRPVVLERHPGLRDVAKAGGLGGQILELLRCRGLLERVRAVADNPHPAPRFPFGGVHVDLTQLADPPMHAIGVPQQRLERVLDERARELGADIRRGHRVTSVTQDSESVTVEVDGRQPMVARYVVGCDGPRSLVRDLAGIEFPGTTYPEVNRLIRVTVPSLPDGDLDVPGVGRLGVGFTRTDGGVFGYGGISDGVLFASTVEEELVEYDDDKPMTLTEFQDSVRRVLGVDLPLGEPLRLSRWQFQARQASRYREGRVLLAGDAAHLLPATGAALNLGMLDAVNLAWKLAAEVRGWAPGGLLDTYETERRYAADRALRQTQAQVALRRGLDPAADALRSVVEELLVDEEAARRLAAMIGGAELRYAGVGSHPLTGRFAPDLPTGGLGARPVLLAGRDDLRNAAERWKDRVDVRRAATTDALLIRPDAHIAWAGTDPSELTEALTTWFGAPR
ncbi:FAD-dependent monooxygenase [Cryptosporangium sp. NPDC048952]|uniref:FAD-dependent monooxygenase n=1 Tax=Cryptosporangium sp. NPDC048952 TaxID=3363961 RepID=UPI003711837D